MSMQPRAWPPWKNEDEIYRRVQSELLEPEREDALFTAGNPDLVPDQTFSEMQRDSAGDAETKALDAWSRGNRKPLADLVDPDDAMLDYLLQLHGRPPQRKDRPIRRQFSAETWSVIRDGLLKKPLKVGAPKKTVEERQNNPIHDAATMVPIINAMLRKNYLDQGTSQVKDRACAFAEKLAGIDDPQSNGTRVANYLRRGKKDRGFLAT